MGATAEPGDTSRQNLESASPEPAIAERTQRILEFEHQWWKHAGAKEEAIRAQFGLSAARYYQLLNAALDDPGSLVFDPMLVKRLQRMRDARTQARSARRVGDQSATDHP
ncbi:DUF3263 domain-containing protein [Lacisediminihabitans sp.]|uniref:DUF3263 domain-containing protein n=1 Tax=Lacisediminihabitans sp. TaxID=2787631 RepID=UPI00374D75A0